MMGVPQIVAAALEKIEGMSEEDKLAELSAQASAVMSEMPPRENQRVNISLDSVHATGPLGSVQCVLRGACNYKQTGLLQAYSAYHLVHGAPRRAGFASACQAFGHRELLGVLQSFGLTGEPELTGDVSPQPLAAAPAAIGSVNGTRAAALATS